MDTPETPENVAAPSVPRVETIAVPDLAAKQAQAAAAIDETIQRVQSLHDSLEGVSAAVRADLMFIKNLLAHIRIKF